MRSKSLPSVETLRQLIDYDAFSGIVTIKQKRSGKGVVGAEPSKNNCGYFQLYLEGKTFSVHRLVWKLYYGEDPSGDIDHINGDRSDNRIDNLRIATRTQNNQNSKIRKDNSSGVKGVHFFTRTQKWQAYIDLNRKRISLGYFHDLESAKKARLEAEDKYHGSYARQS